MHTGQWCGLFLGCSFFSLSGHNNVDGYHGPGGNCHSLPHLDGCGPFPDHPAAMYRQEASARWEAVTVKPVGLCGCRDSLHSHYLWW